MPLRSVTAVVDIGKTNSKLVIIDERTNVLDRVTAKTRLLAGPPYPHLDTEALWSWLIEQLAGFSEAWPIGTIVVTTHGCAAALVDDNGLVLPVLDYEAEPPAEVTAAYRRATPDFDECFTPDLPPGQHLGLHVYWLQQDHPEEFARARYLLAYPQYWAWRLGGAAATEISFLGAHSHLWAHRQGTFSSLVRSMGWSNLFAPMRPAWDVLGTIAPDIARKTGLRADCRLLCGVHDSNAALLLYLRSLGRNFVLASTGTWAILFNPTLSLDALDPARDMLANIDVTGCSVATARFMGGREFEIIAGDAIGAQPSLQNIEKLVAQGTMALPTFAPGTGPFPHGKGTVIGPEPASPEERVALATLYLALMTDQALELLRADANDVVIDGAFASNDLYAGLVMALCARRRVLLNQISDGTALGASLLAGWNGPGSQLDLRFVEACALEVDGLANYRDRWLHKSNTR